jgi:hypothetical protein
MSLPHFLAEVFGVHQGEMFEVVEDEASQNRLVSALGRQDGESRLGICVTNCAGSTPHDEQIETGSTWPAHLARAHTHSRLLIPILSRDYFRSD